MSKDKLTTMEPGEFEMRKVFEEITTKNVKIIEDYSRQTRVLLRGMEEEVKNLKNMLLTREIELNQLRQQLSGLQAKLYVNEI